MHFRTEKPLRYDSLSGFYVLEFGFVIEFEWLICGFSMSICKFSQSICKLVLAGLRNFFLFAGLLTLFASFPVYLQV
ncbi:hypothetical protein CHI10_03905 [Bacillus sp. 7894-2]|nr:hypothetical protein CHI10_03905 [Bacillus sp. 7894-2]